MRNVSRKLVSILMASTILVSTTDIAELAVGDGTGNVVAAGLSGEVINDNTTAMSVVKDDVTYKLDHTYVVPGDTLKITKTVNQEESIVTENVKWTVRKVVSGNLATNSSNEYTSATNSVTYDTVDVVESSSLEIKDSYLETVIYGEIDDVKLTIYCSKTPVMYINSDTDYYSVEKDNYSSATINLVGNEKYSDESKWYSGESEIKLRGNSTAYRAKRPFKLKLGSKADLLGLGVDDDGQSYKSKHWVLLANDIDHSLMRNKLLYDFSGDIGTEFHFESTNVTVIYNGQYEGVYQLCEHRRVDEGQIDITNWTSIGEDAAGTIADAVAAEKGLSKSEKKAFTSELEEIASSDFSWIDDEEIKYTGDALTGEKQYQSIGSEVTAESPWEPSTAEHCCDKQNLTGDFSVDFKFHVNASSVNADQENGFVIEANEGGNYLTATLRGGGAIWGYGSWNGQMSCTYTDDNVYGNGEANILTDADVELNVTRIGDKIEISATITGADGKKSSLFAFADITTGLSDTLDLYISASYGTLSDFQFCKKEVNVFKFSDYGITIPDTTGGYLAEMDFYSIGDDTLAGLTTAYSQPLYFSAPEPGEDAASTAEKKAIVSSFKDTSLYKFALKYTQTFEYAIHSDDFTYKNSDNHYTVSGQWGTAYDDISGLWKNLKYTKNTYTDNENDGKHYSELFDIDSLVTNFLFCEYAMNWDSMKNSFFYYKDVNELAKIGPQWDFDWCWGNTNMYNIDTDRPENWHTTIGYFTREQYYQMFQWNRMFIRDPYFIAQAYEKYHNIRNTYIEDMIKKGGLIDQYYEYLKEAGNANDARWSYTYSTEYSGATAQGFDDSVAKIKNFLNTRVAWLDKQFASIDTLTNSLGYYKSSDKVKVVVSNNALTAQFKATVTDDDADSVIFQINGKKKIQAKINNGTAVASISVTELNKALSGKCLVNTVVAMAVDKNGKYIYSATKTGNYNTVESAYNNFYIHTPVADNAYVAPTCTTTGKTQATHCKVCGVSLTKATVIGKLAHKYKAEVLTCATTKSDGSKVRKCSGCNAEIKTVIRKIGKVTLSKKTFVYNGKVQRPSVTVKDSSGKTLKKGTDYTLTYSSSKKVGTYYVKVTFKGNYKGTTKLKYTILPKSTKITGLKAVKKGFAVTVKKQSSQTTGYEIAYSTDSKFSRNVRTKKLTSTKTISKKITGLKSKKTYYVRVRTYNKTKKLYSAWSAVKKIKTK